MLSFKPSQHRLVQFSAIKHIHDVQPLPASTKGTNFQKCKHWKLFSAK